MLHKVMSMIISEPQEIVNFFPFACFKLRSEKEMKYQTKGFPGISTSLLFWNKGREIKQRRKVIIKELLRKE